MKHIGTLLLITLLFSSCQEFVIGTEPSSDPINTFEIFWEDIDRRSSMIFIKDVNWRAVREQYRSQVGLETSDEELFEILSEMIEVFDDEHTSIRTLNDEQVYSSGAHRIEDAIHSFSRDLIENEYMDTWNRVVTAPEWYHGKIKNKNVGYIYIGDTDGFQPDLTMDTVLSTMTDLKALIFDVRNNGGGTEDFAIGVTNDFARETKLVYTAQNRNGEGYGDFDTSTEVFTTSDGVEQWGAEKPIIVLTDAFTISGAERMTHILKLGNPLTTHMGDTTAGAFSSLSNTRFLPNGWNFSYPVQMVLDPNQNLLDGEGIPPDVYSKNTPDLIAEGKDQVLEDALQFLLDTYGIE